MLEFIISAVGLGIMLSLVFIGPIFFLLIETSFSRGGKHALVLDLGVIFADIVCIVAAYYASSDLVELIDKYPSFYRITALIMLVYGVYMIFSKTKTSVGGDKKIVSNSYIKTFFNGFLLNILNIGVVIFWLATVVSIRNKYPKSSDFMMYIIIVIVTYLGIDLLKILLAKQFHYKITPSIIDKIRKIVGGILILFSIYIFLQSFKQFNQIENKLHTQKINKK